MSANWHRSTGAKWTQRGVVPLAVRARHQQNDQETLFDFSRPAVFTAIVEAAVRGDLLDRAITINLPNIPPEHRRSEAEIEAERDARARTARAEETQTQRREWAGIRGLDDPVEDFAESLETLTRASLLLAGYHRHHGGEWRKRRHG